MAKKTTILFCGGGTGGHLFPIIAIAREIKRLSSNPDIAIQYLGIRDTAASLLLKQENIKIHTIASGKIRRYFSFENIIDVTFKIPLGFVQSFFTLLFNRPALVFSKGGTGSAVVTSAAHILGIPIFIHESDTVPGQSNRLASGWAKKIFISFPKTEYFNLQKTVLVGNPILKELQEGSKESAKELFNLTFQKPVLLFMGGSQGAKAINDFVLSMLQKLLEHYEIIHVCGKKNHQEVYEQSKQILNEDMQQYYHLWEFLDEIPLKHAFAAADVIISRSGSAAIFEIAALGKPSILIPLPSSANDHQSKNAYEYLRAGATIIIEQENLNPNLFIEKINYLLSFPKELETIKQNALAFAKPLAAKAIAREILEFLANPKS